MQACIEEHRCNLGRKAGVTNVEFLKGAIEDIPLPARTIDVVISNCVVNLSADRSAVFAEIHRALSFTEYRTGLENAGFTGIEITLTHAGADGMHSAIVRTVKPVRQGHVNDAPAAGSHLVSGDTISDERTA